MRLRRLRLRDFRGISDRTVDFAVEAATVIVAANEAGKSSLLEALDLLFGLPDDSKAARLRAVRPVGQDVATEVEAELELGTQVLTYRKRWFRQRGTELTVRPVAETGGAQSLTGREAHQEAARLFAAEVDRSLWSALVTPQGSATTLPVAGSVAAVLTALDEAGGGEADHRAAAPLVDAVEAEYLRYFTPTGRPTREHAAALAQHERATTVVSEAQARLAETREDVTRAEGYQAELDALNRRLNDERAHVRALTERRRATTELRRRVERCAAEEELATARRAAAEQAEQARQALVTELAEQEEMVSAAASEAERARTALREHDREAEAARVALDQAREWQAECWQAVAEASQAVERHRDRLELTELDARLRALEQAMSEEQAADASLAELSVDDDTLAEIEAAHRAVLTTRAALAAGAPTVVVRRLGAAPVVFDDAHSTEGSGIDNACTQDDGERSLQSQESVELSVERSVRIRAEEAVDVEILPGEGIAGLTASVAEAEHHEEDLLAAAGAGDIGAARRLARERAEQERRREQARGAVRRHGRDADVAALRTRRSVLAARLVENRPDAEPTEDAETRDIDVADTTAEREEAPAQLEEPLAQAREAETEAMRQTVEAERAEAAARKAYDAVAERATAERVRANHAHERQLELAETVAAQRAEVSDEELAERAQEAREAVNELADAHVEAAAALRDSGGDEVDAELERAESTLQRLQEQVEEIHDALRHVQGRLEMAGAHGLATQLEEAQATEAEAERDRDRLVRRASAAARLRDTVERHRAQARSRYAAPLRERIERLGRVVHDSSFSVELGDDLQVVSRELQGASLPVDSLSLGAREQLAVLVRLAIAELTARDGSGVPVMLDDALGWSDPGRLRAMGQLLAHAAERTQVVVLTCVPNRYVDVPGARWSRW